VIIRDQAKEFGILKYKDPGINLGEAAYHRFLPELQKQNTKQQKPTRNS